MKEEMIKKMNEDMILAEWISTRLYNRVVCILEKLDRKINLRNEQNGYRNFCLQDLLLVNLDELKALRNVGEVSIKEFEFWHSIALKTKKLERLWLGEGVATTNA
jgi:hypothetical protein